MKRLHLAFAMTALLASAAHADAYLQADPRNFDLEGAKRIRVEFPIGKFTLEGDDGPNVRVQVRIECKDTDYERCKLNARRIRIDHSVSGNQFRLEFSGINKNWSNSRMTVEAHVLVPRTLAAELNMGVGKAEVTGLGSDLDLELGVGELAVSAAAADYRDVEAESGVGDASIETRQGRTRERGFIGHSARWSEGRGASFIRAHVGVGQASVELR